MRNVCTLVFLLLASAASAGDYYRGYSIDEYDPATGLYFRAVEQAEHENGLFVSKGQRSEVININVFDPTAGTSRLLFDEPPNGTIDLVLFETDFADDTIKFGGTFPPRYVKNNISVTKREPQSKILIAVRRRDRKETILLVAEKRGGSPTPLATVPAGADWHLDVKNSKLRVVHPLGQTIRIESHEW